MFFDAEDGDTKNLTLNLISNDPALLSWVEFDTEKQTLLALYVMIKRYSKLFLLIINLIL